jgi:hypothetical protein
MRAALLLALLAALAAGCGAAEGQGETAELDLERVASKTGAASARMEIDMAMAAENEASLTEEEREELSYLTFRASGATADNGSFQRLRYVYSRKALGLEGPGEIEFDAILNTETGDAYFAYGPEWGLELPARKRWVHVQDDSLQGVSAMHDPSRMLSFLRATNSGGLEKLGRERVRGVSTTRYAAAVDVERAKEQIDGEDEDLEKSFDALSDAGYDEVPMEIWVDDEEFVRRLVLDWVLAQGDGANAITMKLRLEMWDHGADIHIAAPPESTVVEEEDLG